MNLLNLLGFGSHLRRPVVGTSEVECTLEPALVQRVDADTVRIALLSPDGKTSARVTFNLVGAMDLTNKLIAAIEADKPGITD